MNVSRWYFAFHPRTDIWSTLGHVNAIAATDRGWIFFYPQRPRFSVVVATDDDEIDHRFAVEIHLGLVLRYTGEGELTFPPIAPYSCAAFCGHLVGLRAWTPRGLKRKLLRNGAEPLNAKSEQP